MNFLSVFKDALREANDVYDLHGGNPNLIEFPKDNFVASFMAKEKRIEFSPRDDTKASNHIRSLINSIKNAFRVAKVTQIGMNTFDVVIDPTENFDKVMAYVKDFG